MTTTATTTATKKMKEKTITTATAAAATALGRHLQQQDRAQQQHQQRRQQHRSRKTRPPPCSGVVISSSASCTSALTTPSALLWRYDEDEDEDGNCEGGVEGKVDENENDDVEDVDLSSTPLLNWNKGDEDEQQNHNHHSHEQQRKKRHQQRNEEREVHYKEDDTDQHRLHRIHNVSQKKWQQHKQPMGSDYYLESRGGQREKGKKQRRPWFASSSATSSKLSPLVVSSLHNSSSHDHNRFSYNQSDNSSSNNNNHHNSLSLMSMNTGVQYRTVDSTQRALRELQMKRLKKAEAEKKKIKQRRAFLVSVLLFGMAGLIHVVARRRDGSFSSRETLGNDSGSISSSGGQNMMQYPKFMDEVRGVEGEGQEPFSEREHAIMMVGRNYTMENEINAGDLIHGSTNEEGHYDGGGSTSLPPPVEKMYDPDRQFLVPLQYYADPSDPHRRESDTAFFFQVPRSGGSAVKDILGKCLRLVMCTEVGIRNGHESDTILQVLGGDENTTNNGNIDSSNFNNNSNGNSGGIINVQGRIRYVNVDTTNPQGIQRAANMGLASSGLADVIVSSYFQDAAMLFDLHHQGRAFLILRDPIERAASVYYHRVKTVGDIDASIITLEEYAKGNGIENNWMTRFLTNRMAGELTKEDLDQAKEILKVKFLIGFLDDLEESLYRIMKFNGWAISSEDDNAKMNQEDCIHDLITRGGVWSSSRWNDYEYEVPKRGTQAHALIAWQTQFDSKLYSYAKDLFDMQTKEWGTKERKKLMKKMAKNKGG